MARSTGPMIIAGLSTFIHFALAIISGFGLYLVNNDRSNGDYNNNSQMFYLSGVFLILLAVAVIVEIAVGVASICLIVGILKARPLCVVPWLYATMAYMILSFADFICGSNALGALFSIKLVVFVLHVGMWYPIYKYWRHMRLNGNAKSLGNGTSKVNLY